MLHGTEDTIYSVEMAKSWYPLLTGARSTRLEVIEGGSKLPLSNDSYLAKQLNPISLLGHYLSGSNPVEVDKILIDWVNEIEAAK